MQFANDINGLVVRFFRLIDVGILALKAKVDERLFDRYAKQEFAELQLFKEFLFSR